MIATQIPTRDADCPYGCGTDAVDRCTFEGDTFYVCHACSAIFEHEHLREVD